MPLNNGQKSLKEIISPLYASTPAVLSPKEIQHNLNNTTVVDKNVNLFFASHDSTVLCQTQEQNGNSSLPRPCQRQLFSEPSRGSSLSALSPIDSTDAKYNLQTGRRETVSLENILGVGKQSNVPFPFPTPECVKQFGSFGTNKYQSVLRSLQILKKIDSLNAPDSPVKSFKNHDCKTQLDVGRGIKKPIKTQVAKKQFKFTVEMFMDSKNSSEAFIQVTHFLFTLLDKKEAEMRFRGAWPIYEKKQESLYRRSVLEWLKVIISENRTFFGKGVEVQLQGLIVNPYGDRFIKLLYNFVTFVMLTVSAREGTIPDEEGFKDTLVHKPKFSGKSEVTKRQAKYIESRTVRLELLTVEWMRTLYRNEIMYNKTIKTIMNDEKNANTRLNHRITILKKLMPLKPQYFPEDAISLLDTHEEYYSSEVHKYVASDLAAIERVHPHPLNTYVSTVWKERLQLFGDKVAKITDYFQRHSRLWTLLNLILVQKPIVLDVSTLYFPMDIQNRESLSVQAFIDGAATTVQKFHQKLQNIPISNDLMDKVQDLNSKVEEMKQNAQRIEDIQGPDVKQLKKQVDMELKTLYLRMENVDWSQFSHVNTPPLSTIFSLSPIRKIDPYKETGLTPALSSYLDFGPHSDTTRVSRLRPSSKFHHLSDSAPQNVTHLSTPKVGVLGHNVKTKLPFANEGMLDNKSSSGDSLHFPIIKNGENNSRRSSLIFGKTSMSVLPINEEIEPTDGEEGEVTDSNNAINNNIVSSYSVSVLEDKSEEQSILVPRNSFNRKSLDNVTIRDRSGMSDTSQLLEVSLIDDLEEKLNGIMDVSYADFLEFSDDEETNS